MFKKTLIAATLIALTAALVGVNKPAAAANSNEVRLRAQLTGNTLASGKAKYRERTRGNTLEQRFSVEVEDSTPGDLLAVTVNGVTFGTIVVNDLGVAELQFRTTSFIDDPGDGKPLPPDFPMLMPGDFITVGPDLSGTFALD